MRRTEWLQEVRTMRFAEAYGIWTEGRLTQEQAARILGVSERTFRRYIDRYEQEGLEGLKDKRLGHASARMAPVDEVMALLGSYKSRYLGWRVKHYYSWYKRGGGRRSYTWVKTQLQKAQLVTKAAKRGAHRRKRERAAFPGMMIHQDGSRHQWVPGKHWDLIVTMDDATSEHYSMFFCDEEGTWSSFKGVKEVIDAQGLFCSIYTDRGSHYWYTPEGSAKVDKVHLTQFGRAMHQLGIDMIAAYSPEARGRSERAFRTHQDRLPKELAAEGITSMEQANDYLQKTYMPAFNAEFMVPASEPGTLFVPVSTPANIHDILCEQYKRTVNKDNTVSFEGAYLQIPQDLYRFNYVKTNVRVHRYSDGTLALFHGPRKLVTFDPQPLTKKKAA